MSAIQIPETPLETAVSPWRFSVAPMMEWTDLHCRFFLRQISRHTRLYTEMITTPALVHGSRKRLLRFNPIEHPVALQLGGSDIDELITSTELGEQWGYDEINLNCGCPSDRVQEGRFGACLMREPDHVAASVRAMKSATKLPVTVKHRIGVDDSEDYKFMHHFVETVAAAGCEVFIVHARKAWLKGLSPKENREIPPLQYDLVYRLKQDFPALTIVINGGIKTLEQSAEHLKHVDGVMIGREVYDNPYLLAEVDLQLFGDATPVPSRHEVVRRLMPYVERELAAGALMHHITRHILGLFRGQPGGRAFRRTLSEGVHYGAGTMELLEDALADVDDAQDHAALAA
ncbi:tRNA dihydrouridine(20/20a) synthase DusA [Sinimarinibacterium sp. CAU 1509]|uniref:tRNA dihydrouridine(20/20a) synthase DusA n=1 Tax=Sinimarinibacterium sp. CAU 1509 TaxID=2562283 RepID=UPI0010ABC29D|nr:tRNA dihydrouridine(20/20a) synthase DusA [Sinimarinibacterium sp. CAU 1509]TJY62256.1 tRNA dihydrouridine(20/20a) synthase DusA [Sinimarinibacterium sp. CAU 1509]